MERWNAEQYLKFESQRTRPAIDLAARIPLEHPQKIIDISCSPGNSTAVLEKRFSDAKVLGLDVSENMLKKVIQLHPHLKFQLANAETDLPQLDKDYDIVFSNASLQWIPNHQEMVCRMMELLKPDGILAVQIPMNNGEPIHKILSRLSQSSQWRGYFVRSRAMYNLTPSSYYDLLSDLTPEFHMWQTTYFHHMPDHEAIIEWYRGTGMRQYLEALHPDKQERFVQDVLKEVKRAYPLQKDGSVIFRFPRLFFIAQKKLV